MADATYSEIEKRTMRKVFWRIIPYCFVLYVISYWIARTSVMPRLR